MHLVKNCNQIHNKFVHVADEVAYSTWIEAGGHGPHGCRLLVNGMTPKYLRFRISITMQDILESVKGEKHLTERLLLAPLNQSENINRKQDRHKEVLFQFVTETLRKLKLLHYRSTLF